LWFNSLIIYIQFSILHGGQNFSPFSCSEFSYFQWLSEWDTKSALPDSITWVFGSRFRRGIPL